MRVWADGLGEVDLLPEHFVAEGGEGRVYLREGRAFKVWRDLARAPAPAKLARLARIAHPALVAPEGTLRDAQGAPVGFRMPWVEGASPLAAWVAPGPRARAGVDAAQVGAWMLGLADALGAVHAAGAVVGDLSESNVLIDGRGRLRLIDLDSWGVDAFPVTAFTPATRDPAAPADLFSPETDWFAFAVVSFLMFTGLHPYRGRHPKVVGLEARMQAGLSALDPAVVWPPAALGPEALPTGWRPWYQAVLEGAHRGPPPDAHGAWPAAARPPEVGDSLLRTPVAELDAPILGFAERDGSWVAWTAQAVWRDGKRLGPLPGPLQAVCFSPRGRPVGAWAEAGRLRLFALDEMVALPVVVAADEVFTASGALLVRAGAQLVEVRLHELADRLTPVVHPVASVLPRATRAWVGFAEQRLLGAAWLHLPVGPGRCLALRVPELDARPVVAAAHARGVVHLLTHRAGRYDRVVVRAREGRVDVRVEADVPAFDPEVVVLPSGVAVLTRPEGGLELTTAAPGERALRALPDARPAGRIAALGAGLVEIEGARLVGVRVG
jgi:hypothetical protein